MVMKFVLEKHVEYPYTGIEVCSSAACHGNGAVFRTSFSLAVFFAMHAGFLMVPGCKMFHGFGLFLKFCLLVGLIVATFWIDNDFFEGYGDFARVGSAFWLIIQTLMLVAWAYDLNDGITSRATDADGEPRNKFYILLLVIVVVLFGLEVTGMSLAIDWFGGDECHRNNIFVSITFIMTVLSYVVPMFVERGSILASSIMCGYTTYLLLTALYSDPDKTCNSQYTSDNDLYVWVGIVISTVVLCYGAFNFQRTAMVEEEMADIENTSAKAKKKESKNNNLLDQAEDDAEERQKKEDEIEEAREEAEDQANSSSIIPWNYVKFHIAMAFASLYVCMLFTGWGDLSDETNAFKHSNVTVWVNILTQWATFFFYGWTLAVMGMCPHRFEYMDGE